MTNAQPYNVEHAGNVIDCQIASIVLPGETQPAQVAMVLIVSGFDAPLALRIKTRIALDQLVEALMRHGDEVFTR